MIAPDLLSGIRVLDFSRYVAGPYCAMLIGFLGADVVRIEKRDGGEDRFVAPLTEEGDGAILMQANCNKRGMTLDLKHPRAAEIVRRLVAGADVVIVNAVAAELTKLGLDYASLCAVKPDVILVTQTAYGHDGPWANRGGFDSVGAALSGAMHLSGTPGQPIRMVANYVDFSTAALGAFATLAAVMQRRQTGQGQHVQASLLGTALAAFNSPLIEQAVLGLDRPPTGNRLQTTSPSDVFPTLDGHVLTHVVGNALFARMAKLVGAPEWIADPDLKSDADRGRRRDEICARVGAWCASRDTDEVVETMAAAGVPCAPVLDLDQALAHPQAQAMQFLRSVVYPGLGSVAPVAACPVAFGGVAPAPTRRPPRLGEHTDEILRELGYSTAVVAELRADGVV